MLYKVYKNLIIREVNKLIVTPYYILSAEMKAQRHTTKSLAEAAHIKYPTLYKKLREGRGITVDEALSIKYALGWRMPLEKLFEKKAG